MTVVSVRLSGPQLEHLETISADWGIERSQVIRRLIEHADLAPGARLHVPDRDELLELLAERARAGNVTAIKTLLALQAQEDPEPEEPSPFDALDGEPARSNGRGGEGWPR